MKNILEIIKHFNTMIDNDGSVSGRPEESTW